MCLRKGAKAQQNNKGKCDPNFFLESLPKLWTGYTNKVHRKEWYILKSALSSHGTTKGKTKQKQTFNSIKWQATQTSQKITSIELTAWGSTVQGRSDTPPKYFAINFQSPGSISASWLKEKTKFFFTKLLFFTTSGADSLAKGLCTNILRDM